MRSGDLFHVRSGVCPDTSEHAPDRDSAGLWLNSGSWHSQQGPHGAETPVLLAVQAEDWSPGVG